PAIVTVTVRAARPRVCNVYPATKRLSRAAATRPASWPHGSVSVVGPGLPGVASGSTGGRDVQPDSAASRAATSRVRRAGTSLILRYRWAGSWDRLSRPAEPAGTLVTSIWGAAGRRHVEEAQRRGAGGAEIRRLVGRRRRADQAGRRADRGHPQVRQRRLRDRLRDGRHHR